MVHDVQRIHAGGVSCRLNIFSCQVTLDVPRVIYPVVVCQVACCTFRFPTPIPYCAARDDVSHFAANIGHSLKM